MKGIASEERQAGDDRAVSPVIAVILMVAITVVLAATVYVWVSGFTDEGDQAPSAGMDHVSCSPSSDGVTLQMQSGDPLQMDDIRVIAFNRSSSNDVEEARTDPLVSDTQAYGSQWSTGQQKTIDDSGDEPNWDASWSSSGGMGGGHEYRVDFVHKPTEATFLTVPFTC